MSIDVNPYESTQTNLDDKKPIVSQGFFTAAMIAHLKAASPWMRFIGIICFIGAGFSILIGIIILLMLPYLLEELDFLGTVFSGFINSHFGFVYIISGMIMIFPARYLFNFASKINFFIKTKNERAMEIALRNNKSFWKFHGILLIISLAFIPLSFIITIIAVVGSVM